MALAIVIAGTGKPAWADPALSPIASPPTPRPVAEGPAMSLSLTDAVALGLRENRTIRSAYLERVAQRYDLVVARRRFLPQVDIVAGVTRDRTGGISTTTTTLAPTGSWLLPTGASVQFAWARSNTTAGATPGVTESSSVNIAQPLLRGAGLAVNRAPIRIAKLQEEINQLGLKTTVSDTVTEIVLAYRTLLQAQEQVRLAQSALTRSQSLMSTNQALIDAGRMAAADILQTRAEVATQRLGLLQAQQQKASAQLALLRRVNLDLRTNVVAADRVIPNPVPVDLDRLIGLALDNRMDVLGQRLALEQDRESLRIAQNDRLWDLSVVAGVRRDKAVGLAAAIPDTSSTVGLQLSVPLGDFSLKQAEIHAATTLKVDQVKFEDLRQAVEAQVRDAAQGLDAAWLQLDAAREARDLAGQALNLAGEKLRAGRASNFEVLSFDANLRAAEVQELTAGINYLNALTLLDQQVGGTLATWRIDLND
jgi:outer membrane protein TolC